MIQYFMPYFITYLLLMSLGTVQTTLPQGSFARTAHKEQAHVINIFSPALLQKNYTSAHQAARYHRNNIIQKPFVACVYSDSILQADFGLKGNLSVLFEQYENCSSSNTRIVLAGNSHGASTLFSFIEQKNPKNIGAIIAESPFASIDDVTQHASSLPGVQYFIKTLYPPYDTQATAVDDTTLSTPILIACSKEDTVVPYTSTVRLAHQLKKNGYKYVYLLVFPNGEHGFLSYKEEFQEVANAMYAHHNLPHNLQLAHKGKAKLENYRLS